MSKTQKTHDARQGMNWNNEWAIILVQGDYNLIPMHQYVSYKAIDKFLGDLSSYK